MTHVVVKTIQVPPQAVCSCGESFEAETYDKARLAHVRHALKNHHDYKAPDEDEDAIPF